MNDEREKIYIFGRGQYLEKKIDEVNEKFQVAGFLDNSIQEQCIDTRYQLPVYNPSKIVELEKYRILIEAKSFIEMCRQLISYNVPGERIIFGGEVRPFASPLEEACFSDGRTISVKNQKIYFERNGIETEISSGHELELELRKLAYQDINVCNICSLPTVPYSRTFGTERGTSIDRYYIERFLDKNRQHIKGTVMEVGADTYIKAFGKDVTQSIILHVKGWGSSAIKGNFETGEGISDNMVDCLICTQTLQYIYDVRKAMRNIFRMLRPGGTALFTVPGIKSLCTYDAENWGERWSFTEESMRQMCEEAAGANATYEVRTYGNVKTTIGYLYGLCLEDLQKEDLEYNDKQFPFLITAILKK